ncbi:MAG: S-methyl-5-thioribose-1-phosphate isomerase [Phycisphaerales bacterium]|nr:S-methyl-5-thioribose-1-phosphate isomerase [Phycisphaerales bacterium]MCB9856401.1 S-methyl-5-thioribose-1-phosphate isomerase [Phycisphaerales bacterium]MCB9864532.1 S-methyl-5-thioribose-1-phosphate isomerase [Phycisphaerales bacterium]
MTLSTHAPGDFATETIRPIWWNADAGPGGVLEMIDQTRLPGEFITIQCRTIQSVWDAIKRLSVRGAPAIGVAAAYGVVTALDESAPADGDWAECVTKSADFLATSRPTAVNLFWALDRMRRVAAGLGSIPFADARAALLAEAHAVRDEDAAMCRAIGEHGQHLIEEGAGVLTHCNAGALATAEYGTALALMYSAHARKRRFSVFVDETRPLLQGARLTAWELHRAGIAAQLICDNMAASIMKAGRIQLVVTGADRIAANGDAANKIGTYGVAVLAAAHNIPFYIAAPSSTFDMSLPNGDGIPIENREPDEVRGFGASKTAPADMPCLNPAFDVTPARLIKGIVTEKGIISPVTTDEIAARIG